MKDFVKSRLWKLVKQLATYLSGMDEWYPYDVSMNIIRNSHYPRIHEDCEPSEVTQFSDQHKRLSKHKCSLFSLVPTQWGGTHHLLKKIRSGDQQVFFALGDLGNL